MNWNDVFWPSARNILMWSVALFVAIFFFSPGFDPLNIFTGSGQDSGAPSPATGLVTLPTGKPQCGDLVCTYPETQPTCPADCKTTASISQIVEAEGEATVRVEFHDSRYTKGQKVQIFLRIEPEGIEWNSQNGCRFGGYEMGPSAAPGVIAWPSNTVSEDGYFKIETKCELPPGLEQGFHTLSADTEIIF